MTVLVLGGLDHVYSWDQIDYHDKAVRLSRDFRASFLSTAYDAARSVRHRHYNDLAAVPLAAWVTCFGESRTSFVLGVVTLYAVPTSVVFALLMSTAYRRFTDRKPTSWLAVGWLLTPWLIGAFWTPTVLGRVGVGGLGLVFGAVAVHLGRPLEAQRWWHPVAVGGLLASAVLFRRWYVFAMIGFLAAVAAQTLVALARARRPADRARVAGRLLLLIAAPAAILAAVTMPLIGRILDSAYTDVFYAYHHSGSVMYLWGNQWSLAERLGLPSLVVVLAALALGMLQRRWRGFLAATTLAGLTSLALFSRVQAPGVHHTLIWVGVECIILGVGLVAASAMPRTAARLVVGASVVMLGTSVGTVLFLGRARGGEGVLPSWDWLAPSLTVRDFLPANLDVVRATVDFLETNIPPGSSIAFLASSLSLNDSTLRNISLSLPDSDVDTRYRFLASRNLTPSGRFPGALLRADYVVVVDPTGPPDRSQGRVVRITPGWLFRKSSQVGGCFRKVAGPGALPDGRTITAYEMREGMKKTAKRILEDEIEAAFAERREAGAPR